MGELRYVRVESFLFAVRKNYIVCAWCGRPLMYMEIRDPVVSCETGFFYCSPHCASEHVLEYMEIMGV